MARLCPSQTLIINYSETDLRARKIISNCAHAIENRTKQQQKRVERDGDDNGKRRGLLYEIVREE